MIRVGTAGRWLPTEWQDRFPEGDTHLLVHLRRHRRRRGDGRRVGDAPSPGRRVARAPERSRGRGPGSGSGPTWAVLRRLVPVALVLPALARPALACAVPPAGSAAGEAVPVARPCRGAADTSPPVVSDAGRDTTPDGAPHPTLATDLGLIGGVTVAAALVNPDVRSGILSEGSLDHVLENFLDPIGRAVEGGREDRDHFVHNWVVHPLAWGGMGYYLRERGYSRLDAFLFTQAHSVLWEYVIEGSYKKPSGKDLLLNLAGGAAAVFLLHGWLADDSDRPPGASVTIRP